VPASAGSWSTCTNASGSAAGPANCKWLVSARISRAGRYSVAVVDASGRSLPVLGYDDKHGGRWAPVMDK
jgi:hypothetical protein